MIGDEFAVVLEAARHGSEEAFAALWQDANPALLRYLRVIAPAAAEDVAAETWVHVVRGLTATGVTVLLARSSVSMYIDMGDLLV